MSTTDIRWDGRLYPYAPELELKVDPSLRFHDEAADSVEPITHELLRHALWNVNVENGNTLMKVSGSPVAAFGHDFNPVLLDERGDLVFVGPYIQYLSVPVSSGAKWTLENRVPDPGIVEGDMFLTNDPWIGSAHQMDVSLLAPVFIDDCLFCWVGNTLHHWDLGGTAPGGFSPIAEDMFWEPPSIPPIKLVERGRLRKDIEEMFTGLSRMPALVALDLRAQISGARVAVERIKALVNRYGAATVKGAIRKLQGDSQKAFAARLETIPDGTWTEQTWMESSRPGDRGLYRNRITLTKKGDKLIFTNFGSHPQEYTLATSLNGWKGGILSMLTSQMLFDQMFVLEGALRHCEFRPDPGLLSCASRPSAVSSTPGTTLMVSIGLAGLVISKMLACSSDEVLRREAQSCQGEMSFALNMLSGIDQRGNQYASFLQDVVGAALPAWGWRDGQDTGGWPWDLQTTMPNVEHMELFYPLIYLWRKELADSGGPGRFRGGNGGELAITPHKSDKILMLTKASELCIPGPGFFGGYPSSTNRYQLLRGAGILKKVASGESMPGSVDEVGGENEWIGPNTINNEILPGDVWVCAWTGASGYGDPLLRDVSRVEEDVTKGRVTEKWALEAHGVLVGDSEATKSQRLKIVSERLGRECHEVPTLGSDDVRQVTDSIGQIDGRLVCRSCRYDLGPVSGNFKKAARTSDFPLTSAGPDIRDPSIYTDEQAHVRHYYCPECGLLLNVEVIVNGDPGTWDTRLGHTEVADAREL